VTRSTDSTHGSSGAATKRFVDANVSITPNGVKEEGHAHTLTIYTTALPPGSTASLTSITPHVTPDPGTGNISDTCSSPTGSGAGPRTCTVTINSSSPFTFTATATAFSLSLHDALPIYVTRSTDSTHGSSGAATKRFVDANVSITPNG